MKGIEAMRILEDPYSEDREDMLEELEACLQSHRHLAYRLLRGFTQYNQPFLLHSDVLDVYDAFGAGEDKNPLEGTALEDIFRFGQEAAKQEPWVYLAVRPKIAHWVYFRFNIEDVVVEEIEARDFLMFKEKLVLKSGDSGETDEWLLELDLEPFNRELPKMKETRSIGRGVEFLNRNLSSRLFLDSTRGNPKIFEFLKGHHVNGVQLMLNHRLQNADQLRTALRHAMEYLDRHSDEAEWDLVGKRLENLGFEPGWGRSVDRMRETMSLLSDILEAPDHLTMEDFLGRIPMIFKIAILSPHGYFGQANVLGRPDTGGQIVYILDQVRALEKEMVRRIHEQGVDAEPQILIITRLIPEADGTTCDQPRETIVGLKHTKILRVPFRNRDGEIIPHWISRFELWPYLERFAVDVEKEMRAEMKGTPDFIVGNYSDGNLVASLLSHRMHVTQCNIAHAFEKTKYLMSDLYWQDSEPEYHFSCQFTADLIAMNTADFIITSTYQEIAGNREGMGQYESYHAFTMPQLYRVINGINVFDPKFNIVSPGANAEVYFPYTEAERRLTDMHDQLEELVFGSNGMQDSRGHLADSGKPLIFLLSRLDKNKNMAGMVEWYAKNPHLREKANILAVGGFIRPDDSRDFEERHEIERMHRLMDEYQLDEQVRWLGMRLDKNLVGELYRYVADHHGIYVNPGLFEGFGLTVVEAMICGVPTFATCYGGPSEIIVDGVSGFHINPNYGEEAADKMAGFFDRCQREETYWERISQQGIDRVESHYTWKLYAQRMITLSCVYRFWKYVTNIERDEMRKYLETLYFLQFRKRAETLLPNQRE